MDLGTLVLLAPPYVALGVPVYLWYKSRQDKAKLDLVNALNVRLEKHEKNLEKHEEKCDEIPKVILLEKIQNLDDKFCEYLDSSKEFRKDVKEEFKLQREQSISINKTIASFIVKRQNLE